MDPDAKLASLFRRQHGLVTRRQALMVITPAAIRSRLETGRWIPTERSVYRHCVTEVTWEQQVLAHCLGVDGVASHRCAAAIWRLDGCRQSRPELTIARGKKRSRLDATVHESKRPDLFDVQTERGLPVTGAARTLFDLSGVVSHDRLQQAVDDARRRELVTFDDLYDLFLRYARRGRPGSSAMRAFLDSPDEQLPESHWSRRVALMIIEAGLPAPQLEYSVPQARARLDLAYPAEMLGIELDSVTWHLNRTSFESDRRRRNQLELLGWRILNFTWADYQRPGHIARVVRQALALPRSA